MADPSLQVHTMRDNIEGLQRGSPWRH